MEVLVVDDTAHVRELFRRHLEPQDVRVEEASDRATAVQRVTHAKFDAVFIDWVLLPWTRPESEGNGIDVCRALRTAGETAPVWMYSALARGGEAQIAALDAGADEFIGSPLENLELLAARVRAMRRRREWNRSAPPATLGSIAIDSASRVACVAGLPMALTRSEFALLAYLGARPDRSVSHDELFRNVLRTPLGSASHPSASPDRRPASNALTVLVLRVRGKLGRAAAQLETVRGFGYRLRMDV